QNTWKDPLVQGQIHRDENGDYWEYHEPDRVGGASSASIVPGSGGWKKRSRSDGRRLLRDQEANQEASDEVRFFNDAQFEAALRGISEEDLGRIIRDEDAGFERRRDEGGLGLRADALQRGDRAAIQRLARLEVDRRREAVAPGRTKVDLADLSDDDLNARITRLHLADPVGNNEEVAAALEGALRERDRRAAGDPIATRRIEAVSDLDDDQIANEIDALPDQIDALGAARPNMAVEALQNRLLDLLSERNRRGWERREAEGGGVVVDRVAGDLLPNLNPFGPSPQLEEGRDWESQARDWTLDQQRAWLHADQRRLGDDFSPDGEVEM
ncbi:uncharacterized protein METZ01_LOCUS343277, partial [marine metagenome]